MVRFSCVDWAPRFSPSVWRDRHPTRARPPECAPERLYTGPHHWNREGRGRPLRPSVGRPFLCRANNNCALKSTVLIHGVAFIVTLREPPPLTPPQPRSPALATLISADAPDPSQSAAMFGGSRPGFRPRSGRHVRSKETTPRVPTPGPRWPSARR